VTQSPTDVPDDLLAQLGSRVQHQLRAATPNDAKALKATVNTYPTSSYDDLGKVILSLGIGEAIVTVMNERGAPTPVAWTRLRAPESLMAPAEPSAMDAAVKASPGWATYSQTVDRESASEKLAARMRAGAEKAAAEEAAEEQAKTGTTSAPKPRASKPQDSTFEKVVKSSTFKYAVRYAAREAVRGMFGIGRR
jgi:DNA helicase HerA-like ATPase